MLFNYRHTFRHTYRATAVIGSVSGLLTNSVTVSGPFLVLFLANQAVPKEVMRATLAFTGFCTSGLSILFLVLAGIVTWLLLGVCLLMAPALALGYMAGLRLLDAVDPVAFRRMTVLLVLVAGVLLVLSEVRRMLCI